ncbi:MAG TPA: glycine cleavage T C-terminal barrel domain-containing protein [Rhizomicrobium sp.]|jgi:aminomethyltransferase|nr:glycine cleavage T C-terminal barrel domain-containing protein [Rhizomicrobium sp.]
MSVRATPFHARAAEANGGNSWIARNGFTLAREYCGAREEALAARMGAVMADISWRWRVMLEGPRTAEFLSRLTTRDAGVLEPGHAHKALWLTDAGGYRGAGVIARYGRDSYLLAAAACDAAWIGDAAQRFDVSLRDVSESEGGLGIIGPAATALIADVGLDATLEPLAFRKMFWRGLDVVISRWGEHGGFEVWCAADDGVVVWDRLMKVGQSFGLLPAGSDATDILDMEAGVARPSRDYEAASDGLAAEPSPKMLRLERLIEDDHLHFNGRAAYRAAQPKQRLVGIALDSETPFADTILYRDGATVGRMLTSLYSPALRRAIGFGRIDASAAVPGTKLSVMPAPDANAIWAHVTDLPFLAAPAPIGA